MVKKQRTKYTPLSLSSFYEDPLATKAAAFSDQKRASLLSGKPIYAVSGETPKEREPEKERKKKNRQCNYGSECKRNDCMFLHPGETMPVLEKVEKERPPFRKTRMCKYIKKCGKGKNCPFAHSESEIYVPECRYGYRCKKQKRGEQPMEGDCKFSHPPPPPPPPSSKWDPEVEEEKTFEFETEQFPTVNGSEEIDYEPSVPVINFSHLADEDFDQKQEERMQLVEESKGKCTIGGSIDDMMKIFETMEGHDIYQYTFTF
jgi:RNA-binding, Nab2-type zinc finger